MKAKWSFLLILTLVLSMFLSACGGGDNAKQPADDTEGKEGNGEVAEEQLFRANIRTEPGSLNPNLATDSTSSSVLLQTFEGLTRIGQDGKPENAMASDVQVSDDLQTYTFTIRDGAEWTNGDPVTAQDFEYAWKWALDPMNQAKYAYQLYYLVNAEAANAGEVSVDEVGVKAVDEKTLEVQLENPTPYFLELTAFYTYFPVNSKIAKENPEWYTDAGELYTSNGPFKMDSWEHQSEIVLVKNDNYWDADTVKLDRIELYMIDDANTELQMYENGELDWAGAPLGVLPTEAIPSLQDEGKIITEPIAGTYWYKFHTEKEPLTSVHIRKALAYAIDRKAIVENITKAGQIPAMAAVPPTMMPGNEEGYFEDGNVELAKEELQKGLDELGLSSVEELPTITISYNTSEAHAKIAQAIQQMWNENLGINTELSNEEWAVYLESVHAGDFQVARLGWLGDFNDPINFLELYKELGGNNDTRWHSEEFASLLEQSKTETDPDARMDLLKQAEQIFMDEMPVSPIYFYTNSWLQAENLNDVVVSGLGDVQFKWAYFE